MIDYITQNLWLLWTIVTFVCLTLELTSGDFYVTCFAIGAVVSIPAALIGLPFWVQVVVWAIASIVSILLIRPQLVKRLHEGGEERVSNADALIGRIGQVIEPIEAGNAGYVKVDGDNWKAVAGNEETIRKGEKVRIVARDSIIVTVERI